VLSSERRRRQRATPLRAGLAGLVVSGVAIALIVVLIDLEVTVEVLAGTQVAWLAATLLLAPAQVILRSIRWQLVLPRDEQGRRPRMRRIAGALLVGQFANLVLPARLGEPVRAYLVGVRERIPFSRVLGSIVLERVMDLASLALVAIAAAIVVGAPEWIVQGSGAVALVAAAAGVLLVASAIPRAMAVAARLLQHIGWMPRVAEVVTSFGKGAGGDTRGSLAVAVVLSTITWFFVGGTFWLVGRSLGLDIDPAAALLIAAVTTLGTAIPSAPANIGTFEAAAVVAARALGIPGAEALAFAIVAHIASTVPFAFAGAGAAAWMSLSVRSVADRALDTMERDVPDARAAG
jgi:glycosyltransferase 2 family protein